MVEADLPIVKIAQATSNPGETLRRSFGTRRMKTLRSRARAWTKVREWLVMFVGETFPRDVSDMLEYLLFMPAGAGSRMWFQHWPYWRKLDR